MKLADRPLNPPRGGEAQRLRGETLAAWAAELNGDWQVVEATRLEKTFSFPDFAAALAFVNRVGELAESVDHHPEITLAWGRATVVIWTHSIGGLSEADFVFAARINQLQ